MYELTPDEEAMLVDAGVWPPEPDPEAVLMQNIKDRLARMWRIAGEVEEGRRLAEEARALRLHLERSHGMWRPHVMRERSRVRSTPPSLSWPVHAVIGPRRVRH
jgi:hypothetical protein